MDWTLHLSLAAFSLPDKKIVLRSHAALPTKRPMSWPPSSQGKKISDPAAKNKILLKHYEFQRFLFMLRLDIELERHGINPETTLEWGVTQETFDERNRQFRENKRQQDTEATGRRGSKSYASPRLHQPLCSLWLICETNSHFVSAACGARRCSMSGRCNRASPALHAFVQRDGFCHCRAHGNIFVFFRCKMNSVCMLGVCLRCRFVCFGK
jgi:hypothetical protein